jgi:SAM-dependent methyltransferase
MVDFDAVYRGDTPLGGRPPWDIDEPQPVVVDLERSGRFGGAVLDAGCGTGEHTIFLAGQGYDVVGADVSEVAVDKARAKASEQGVSAEFTACDALELADFHDRFDTVLDCGLFDVCPPKRQRGYAAALHRACRPGAYVYLLELSADSAVDMMARFTALGVPEQRLTELPRLVPEDLRVAFEGGWREERLTTSTMRVRLPGSAEQVHTPAIFAAFQRLD